jgi:YD repeat-containing protein
MRRVILAVVAMFISATGAFAGVAYTYDDLGRLTKAAYDNGKEIDYSYDPAGNRGSVVTQNSPPHAPVFKPASKKAKAKPHRKAPH